MTDWPHAPPHRFTEKGTYIITGATYKKEHFFKKPESLDVLQNNLFVLSNKYNWSLHAWSIFTNHYHFIAHSSNPANLKNFLAEFHIKNATYINSIDNTPTRKVWHQYWDTLLTYQNSYLSRLKYVMNNPVKHAIVSDSKEYPWCSAAWFERHHTPSFIKTINSFKIDNVNVIDDF